MFRCTRGAVRRLVINALLPMTCCWFTAQAQDTVKLLKVDPPNWWAAMPKPMLLVRGEGLGEAKFSLSDAQLRVEKTVVSDNGHWAQLWLSASPAQPETVTLQARHAKSIAEMHYTFAAR